VGLLRPVARMAGGGAGRFPAGGAGGATGGAMGRVAPGLAEAGAMGTVEGGWVAPEGIWLAIERVGGGGGGTRGVEGGVTGRCASVIDHLSTKMLQK
jgi:hypothetical protein